jgi:serine/threonine protein kinase
MLPARWNDIKGKFEEALLLEPALRAVYLAELCAGDPDLHEELESLIAAHERSGSYLLNAPLADVTTVFASDVEHDRLAGRRIGSYQIMRQIGAGGMGEVYSAFRADDEYKKLVAIKLVRSGHGSDFVLSRFKNERQILASLDHPNIARLLDGGTTSDGLPFFVMELIEGQPIDEYCATRKLSITERLNLFLQVCSAVQFAHQHLVIHRDIKPGNILVTSDGVPKLLDFGIAKILEETNAGEELDATLTAFRVLTLGYASPEQIKGEPITTASDVYSLGVVLFKLLTGLSPYRVSNSNPHEVSRVVCEFEPERPSLAVRRLAAPEADRAPTVDQDRVSTAKLSKQLKGDLDNIVLKALRKEPSRRYGSVVEFEADIRRHFEHLPVLARKGTVRYRASKFIRRHAAGLVSTALVVAALLAGMGFTLSEKRRADRRFNDVRALANSLLFEIHDSIRDLPGSTPARKLIVDDALRYLDSLSAEGGSDPSLTRELATAYERVGEVQGHYLQSSLGDTAGSLRSYQKALQLRQQLVKKSRDWNDQLALARSFRLVGNQLWATGDWRGAIDINARAVSISEVLQKERPNDLSVLDELGRDYYYAAQIPGGHDSPGWNVPAIIRENYTKSAAVDAAMLKLDPGNEKTLRSYEIDLTQLGNMRRDQDGDAAGALDIFRKCLEMAQALNRRAPTTQHMRDIGLAYYQIASIYSDHIGDSKQALRYYRKGLETYRQAFSADPANALLRRGLAIAYANVGSQEGITGDRTGSMNDLDRGVEIMKGVVALSPQNVRDKDGLAQFYSNRGDNYLRWHQSERAMQDDEDACALYRELRSHASDNHIDLNIAGCSTKLGFATLQAGRIEAANALFHQSLTLVAPFLAVEKPEVDTFYPAADSYAGLGDGEALQGSDRSLPIASRRDHWNQALDWYRKSTQIWERVPPKRRERYNGSLAEPDPGKLAADVRRCESTLASMPRMAGPR